MNGTQFVIEYAELRDGEPVVIRRPIADYPSWLAALWGQRCPPTYRREEAVKTLIALGWTWDGKSWIAPAPAEQGGRVDEAMVEVTDGAGKFAYLGGSPALPAGTKLYTHAERARVPELDAEDWKVLQRLRNALPDVGLNGWHRGVTVLSKILSAAPSQPEDAVRFPFGARSLTNHD